MGRKQEVSPGSLIFCTQDQYFDYVIKPRNTNSQEPYRRPPGAASDCGSPRGQLRYSSLHYVLPNSATMLPAISWNVTTLCISCLPAFQHQRPSLSHKTVLCSHSSYNILEKYFKFIFHDNKILLNPGNVM
jgi:hypothetical protein